MSSTPAKITRDAVVADAEAAARLKEALHEVRKEIAAACRRAQREAAAVTLVAVSKSVPEAAVLAAIGAQQRIFGENRVQEAKRKFSQLKRERDLELHLIGALQANKAADAVNLFDVIHSLDRPSLAAALAKAINAQGRRPRLLVQVNTGCEPQKSGVLPQSADAFLALCREQYGLTIEGLMCIPPFAEPPEPHFALLKTIAERNRLPLLSMGMSADFAAAIALGATHVRIGTAIFGPRQPRSANQ